MNPTRHFARTTRRFALLLALIVSALTVLAPASLMPATRAWAASAPAVSLGTFDGSSYGSLDLARAARDQYGSNATVVATCDHLYCWKASVNGTLYGLDVRAAVRSQYGSGWTLAAVGVHKYDWRAVNFHNLNYKILPVMPVASDYFFNVDAVRTGLASFRSVLVTIQNWYYYRAGESFNYLQPLIVPTNLTAGEWNTTSYNTQQNAHRDDLLNAAISAYTAWYPAPGSTFHVAMAPYAGSSPDYWWGAAQLGGYAVATQRATSITCPATGALDSRCADATYAIGHELGHTFGLQHSCDAYPGPQCGNSIMQTGKPQSAILLPQEITTLRGLPFFTP
jgi:predicted Zn-dependent protease